jgi:hypothetical protein
MLHWNWPPVNPVAIASAFAASIVT